LRFRNLIFLSFSFSCIFPDFPVFLAPFLYLTGSPLFLFFGPLARDLQPPPLASPALPGFVFFLYAPLFFQFFELVLALEFVSCVLRDESPRFPLAHPSQFFSPFHRPRPFWIMSARAEVLLTIFNSPFWFWFLLLVIFSRLCVTSPLSLRPHFLLFFLGDFSKLFLPFLFFPVPAP